MNYISIKHLKALRACKEQVDKFQEIFGSSVKFESLEEAQELAIKYAQEFDFYWIGAEVFRKTYQEAVASLMKHYQDAVAPLLKAYKEDCAKIFAKMWWELPESSKKLHNYDNWYD